MSYVAAMYAAKLRLLAVWNCFTLQHTKTEVSLAGSSFEIASGVSKVALSFVVDLFSPSNVLAVALIISALINLLLCSPAKDETACATLGDQWRCSKPDGQHYRISL